MKRGKGVEVLCSAGGGLAANDVLEGGDHDIQAVAEWLSVCGAAEVYVAIGAVWPCGDVEVARIGREIPDLGVREQARVGGECDGRFVGNSDTCVELLKRGSEPLEVGGLKLRGDVYVAREHPGTGQRRRIGADHDVSHAMAGENLEDALWLERCIRLHARSGCLLRVR